MSLNEMKKYTFTSKYANWIKDKKRRETWSEAVNRSKQMMLQKYEDKIAANPELIEWINYAYDSVKDKEILGSQRCLQFGGEPILKKNARMFNCIVSHCDRPRFFQEAMYLLLCGCGTGFSVQKHHIAKLPKLQSVSGNVSYTIPDSIEGWSDAIGILVNSYFQNGIYPEYEGKNVKFIYTKIRKAGSSISSSSIGKAPGPEPLKKAISKIKKILEDAIKNGQEQLTPIQCYDIVMHASDAVLSGGIRRSATICLFSEEDEEMANAKTGNWFQDNPQRGRSNNSVLLLRNKVTREKFNSLIENTKQFGEPGFVWSDSTEFLVNPCFSKDTRLATVNGLVKISDMNFDNYNNVLVDNRISKRGITGNRLGCSLLSASPVKLTGKNRDLYKVTTSHGYSVTVTDNHTWITKNGRVETKDLSIGDKVGIQSGIGCFGKNGTYNTGFILGLITSDGTFDDNSAYIELWNDDLLDADNILKIVNQLSNDFGCKESNINYCENKIRIGGVGLYNFIKKLGIENPKDLKVSIQEYIWRGSENCVSGFIAGMVYGNGSVQLTGNNKKSTLSLRINQSNKKILEEIQVLLLNYGIVSSIYLRRDSGFRKLPDGSGGYKDYLCKENYDLIVNRPNCIVFEEKIKLFGRKEKQLKTLLDLRGRNCNKKEKFITKISSIEYVGCEDVYCLNQPNTNSVIANGIAIGQCVEIGFFPYLVVDEEKYNEWLKTHSSTDTIDCHPEEIGLSSGWQACNLSTINGGKATDRIKFLKACKAAAIIGTLQAGFTDFEYLGKISEEIIKKEALLGVSITGVMENPDVCLNPSIQTEGAILVRETNELISSLIGINIAARTTCIKPEGTSSCVLGTSSGIHPHHAKRYIRRIQANKLEDVYNHFRKINPIACESSVWSNNDSDDVVSFCIEVPDGSKLKNQLNALEMLENVKSTYQNWVLPGRNLEKCVQPWLTHNVSNTITVMPNEWDDVAKYIYDNKDYFCAISLLSMSGDKDFPQAPFTAIYLPSEICRNYGDGALMASGLVEQALTLFDDNLWTACDSLLGYKQVKGKAKTDWIERCKRFCTKYNGGDVKKLTYLMKDVYNWKLWLDLTREYKSVDYTECIEEKDNTNFESESACAGGTCELI